MLKHQSRPKKKMFFFLSHLRKRNCAPEFCVNVAAERERTLNWISMFFGLVTFTSAYLQRSLTFLLVILFIRSESIISTNNYTLLYLLDSVRPFTLFRPIRAVHISFHCHPLAIFHILFDMTFTTRTHTDGETRRIGVDRECDEMICEQQIGRST